MTPEELSEAARLAQQARSAMPFLNAAETIRHTREALERAAPALALQRSIAETISRQTATMSRLLSQKHAISDSVLRLQKEMRASMEANLLPLRGAMQAHLAVTRLAVPPEWRRDATELTRFASLQAQMGRLTVPYTELAQSIAPMLTEISAVNAVSWTAFRANLGSSLRNQLQQTARAYPVATLPYFVREVVHDAHEISRKAALIDSANSPGDQAGGESLRTEEVARALDKFLRTTVHNPSASAPFDGDKDAPVAVSVPSVEKLDEIVAFLIAKGRPFLAGVVLVFVLPYVAAAGLPGTPALLVFGTLTSILGNLLTPYAKRILALGGESQERKIFQLATSLSRVRFIAHEKVQVRRSKRSDSEIVALPSRGQAVFVLKETRRWRRVEGVVEETEESFIGWVRKGDLAEVVEAGKKALQ